VAPVPVRFPAPTEGGRWPRQRARCWGSLKPALLLYYLLLVSYLFTNISSRLNQAACSCFSTPYSLLPIPCSLFPALPRYPIYVTHARAY